MSKEIIRLCDEACCSTGVDKNPYRQVFARIRELARQTAPSKIEQCFEFAKRLYQTKNAMWISFGDGDRRSVGAYGVDGILQVLTQEVAKISPKANAEAALERMANQLLSDEDARIVRAFIKSLPE